MALIRYGNIVLPYTDLTEFTMEAVYDPSDTDRILTKYLISAQTVVNQDFINLCVQDIPVTAGVAPNVVATWQLMKEKLYRPRQALSVKFNGVEMMPEKQQGIQGTVDAANGPKPRKVELIPMDGATSTTFILLFSIEASYWVRQSDNTLEPNKNLPGNVVLYNRWTESVDIDEENRTVKKRSGKIMIRSDNVKGFIADTVRNSMAVVGLPPGRFLRHKSSYTVSEDGLGLSYEVIDREVFRLPPPPAFKADAEYAEQGTKGDGKRFLSFRIRLWGDNNTSQVSLIKTCAAISILKIQSRGGNLFGPRGDAGITIGSTLRVGGYENWAEYRLIALKPAIPNVTTGVGAFGNAIAGAATGAFAGGLAGGLVGAVVGGTVGLFGGNQGGGIGVAGVAGVVGAAQGGFAGSIMASSQDAAFLPDPGITPNYLVRGTASLLLQAANYYDPSLQNTKLGAVLGRQGIGANEPLANFNGVQQLNEGTNPGRAGVNPE